MTRTIGIIGIGLLGQAMAERLLTNGYTVYGFDPRPDSDQFTSRGGHLVDSPTAVAQRSHHVILCLPDSTIAKRVIAELPEHLANHVIIDTTTGAPDDATFMAAELKRAGAAYVDAAVAGSSDQMRSHQATLLVSCLPETHRECTPIFETLAAQTYHVGDVGDASKMKLVVNLAIGLHRAVLGEALAFGEAMGFDSQQVVDVLLNTPAHSAAMEAKADKMIQSDFAPQARLRQHLKDVKLMVELAEQHDACVPLTTLHETLLSALIDAGEGEMDNSVIVKAFRK